MTSRQRVFAGAIALTLIGVTAPQAIASTDSQFASLVRSSINDARREAAALQDMSNSEFNEFVSCAVNVMVSGATRPQKEYVLAGGSTSAKKARLDEVGLQNQAKLKKAVNSQCYL